MSQNEQIIIERVISWLKGSGKNDKPLIHRVTLARIELEGLVNTRRVQLVVKNRKRPH